MVRSASPGLGSGFVSVMSVNGLPSLGGEGNTSPDGRRSGSTASSTATAAFDTGTRCSSPSFILVFGMRYSRASRSILSQVAPLASPDRHAVRTTNRRHARAGNPALDAVESSRDLAVVEGPVAS